MSEINLLPWRAESRARRKQFFALVILLVLALLAAVWLFHHLLNAPPAKPKMSAVLSAPAWDADFQQIKFVGYVHQHERTWGLLLLPNGETQEVQIGTVLSIGAARVISITEKQLTVIFPNQQRRTLFMAT